MGIPPNVDKWIKVRGAAVESPDFILPSSDETIVAFADPPEWQNGDFFNATSPTRVKVPAKLKGRYLAHAVVQWTDKTDLTFSKTFRDGCSFFSRIMKNGDTSDEPREARAVTAPIATASMTPQSILWETSLAKDDFLEVYVRWYVSDPAVRTEISALKLKVWLTLRRLGKST
jgi:hypothetical protein